MQLGLASGQRLADGDDLLFVMQGRISLEFLLGKAASMRFLFPTVLASGLLCSQGAIAVVDELLAPLLLKIRAPRRR